jgi:molecular chaperone GrpE
LTPEAIETILADFRCWLQQVATVPAVSACAPEETLDLHTLLAQFTALRHEVNLQTRASRAQLEQNTETLAHLAQALEALEQSAEAVRQEQERAEEELLRSLLKALVDAHDALSLAEREVQRVREKLAPALEELRAAVKSSGEPNGELSAAPSPPSASPRPGFWARLFGRDRTEETGRQVEQLRAEVERLRQQTQAQDERQRQVQEVAGWVAPVLDSLLTGYTMSLQRLERALRQQGLEPIAAVGEPFDPERMEVLEAVAGSERPANEVVGEVRRGYLWRGRVFRFAQVRVARSGYTQE